VRSRRAGHLRVDFTLLHETQKGCIGKPLLDGYCFTGLVGSCRNADNQAAKHEHKSERSHSIPVRKTLVGLKFGAPKTILKSRSKD